MIIIEFILKWLLRKEERLRTHKSLLFFALKVIEQLRDVLVEEQRLKEASLQEANSTTHKVSQKLAKAKILIKQSNTNSLGKWFDFYIFV